MAILRVAHVFLDQLHDAWSVLLPLHKKALSQNACGNSTDMLLLMPSSLVIKVRYHTAS